MRTNPLRMFRQTGLGWKLLRKGRFSLKREAIEHKHELHAILKALEKEHMVKTRDDLAPAGEMVS